MSKPPTGHKAGGKDMYWFAHGGIESNTDKFLPQRSNTPGELDEESSDTSYPSLKSNPDRKGFSEEPRSVTLLKDSAVPHLALDIGHNSSALSSLEREDRVRLCPSNKRTTIEDRKKQLWEAEQERNDAVLRKHMEREAALEARRNAQRSNISFAFGSSVPRNLEASQPNQGGEPEKLNRFSATCVLPQKSEESYESYRVDERRSVSPINSNGVYGFMGNSLVDGISPRSTSAQSGSCYDRKTIFPPSWLVGSGALIGEDIMTRSMTASVSAPRGRRKNDLTPTVPYERTGPPPRNAASSSTRKRSVSMTRLDQLAQPRKHYIEANKANSTASSGASSMHKDTLPSPSRPLSSASEQSAGSGRVTGGVNRRTRASPRKPRPVSIAGTVPDQRPPFDVKVSPIKRSYTPSKRSAPASDVKKAAVTNVKSAQPKASERSKPAPRPTTAPKPSPPKNVTKQTAAPKMSTPKAPATKKPSTNKKKADILVATPINETAESGPTEAAKPSISPARSPTPDSETNVESDKNNTKRIISEEEAKTALAEKRRLAREQAEREAELERQRQEELRIQEEESLRKEEEEQRKMEEESMRLLEEHRRQEEEKLRKAIEEQERKEEEEKSKKEEELRLKAEQEKKAKEEAEKQRIELEEKLRKEEEERAERKKRLEKIMSRTRGKTSGSSPSGSISGSDQLDSGENQQEGFSSGANSLDSNGTAEIPSEALSVEDNLPKTEPSSVGNSLEANPTYEIASETESLNSYDMMLPTSENASQDNSLLIIPGENDSTDATESTYPVVEAASDEVSEKLSSKDESTVAVAEIGETTDDLSSSNQNAALAENQWIQQTPEEGKTETGSILQIDNPDTMTAAAVIAQDFDPMSDTDKHSASESKAEALEQKKEMSFEACDISKVDNSATQDEFANSIIESSPTPIISEVYDEQIQSPEVMQFDDGFTQPLENYSVEKSSIDSSSVLDQAASENAEMNQDSNTRDSTSSDMKLPDPIYEITSSDEGSISSEKPRRDLYERNEFDMFHDSGLTNVNIDPIPAHDDVFSEQEVIHNATAPMLESTNPVDGDSSLLEKPANQASLMSAHEGVFQDDAVVKHSEDSVAFEAVSANQDGHDFSEVQFRNEQEVMSPDSFPNVDEGNMHSVEPANVVEESEGTQFGDAAENPFLQTSKEVENFGDSNVLDSLMPGLDNNPFSASEDHSDNVHTKLYSDNTSKGFTAEITNADNIIPEFSQDMNEVNYSHFNSGSGGDFTFGETSSPSTEFNKFVPQAYGDSHIIQQSTFIPEQNIDCEKQLVVDKSSNGGVLQDVTVITDDGSGDCIGIITSIDQVQAAPTNFSKSGFNNEHLKNNFHYAVVTDSEDSSLDSNLSQVMNVETSEKETDDGLNYVENTNKSGIDAGLPDTLEQQGYLFNVQPFYNGDSISKSNGTHLFSEETVMNGHRIESSGHAANIIDEFPDYVQLGRVNESDISSVDHSKVNIFENVDAIDFSKVSPDPFLAKGNSNQVSGNPFLVQDEQKKVLMTPDFFN